LSLSEKVYLLAALHDALREAERMPPIAPVEWESSTAKGEWWKQPERKGAVGYWACGSDCADASDANGLRETLCRYVDEVEAELATTKPDAAKAKGAYMSPRDLATKHDVGHDALRKRLERARRGTMSRHREFCICNEDARGPAASRSEVVYLYREDLAMPIIDSLQGKEIVARKRPANVQRREK
jgi:hypothetical protein